MTRALVRTLALAAAAVVPTLAHAQISITTAVDLSLRNSPRIKQSEAELAKARAVLDQSKDVFIPSVSVGAGLGQSYGYSPNPPTLLTVAANSLIYSASQFPYIHSARAGFNAARLSVEDMRQGVAEDAALTFLALEHDQDRDAVLSQQYDLAQRLLAIVQDRVDAGRDSQMELIQARLTVARLHLAQLHGQDETETDRAHLGRLMGLPPTALRAEGGFPSSPLEDIAKPDDRYASPAVAAAYMTARAKLLAAQGDAKYLFRPQFALIAQYNRYATFTDSFKNLPIDTTGNRPSANEEVFGVQITIPLLDRFRRDKNVESAAEASRALHEAEYAQMTALDGQSRLSHSMQELQARSTVAELEQQLAQQQLEVVQQQLAAPVAGAPAITPKDEQNARIAERDKYLAYIDSGFNLHQAQVQLLRQTGHLIEWLTRAGLTPPPEPPIPTLKHP